MFGGVTVRGFGGADKMSAGAVRAIPAKVDLIVRGGT